MFKDPEGFKRAEIPVSEKLKGILDKYN